ncbi:Outer membrane efflux protein [Cyclobacterium lianum]|uniref:Outer membrane efflux protein n=1 Tax=Cyclobacterium lianum TaxID=388280 RepID=A0A1M7PFH3_9BACT|nr:TolC family protein [Cyclobacterium lianum]SHN15739.1 Outer membrane efflux protein [Cyclobacterium lianum]
MKFVPLKTRSYPKLIVILVAVIFSTGTKGIAQETSDPLDKLALDRPLESQLFSLDSIISMALANHPTIKLNEALVGSAEERVKLAKKSWTDLFRIYIDYGYGNQAILTTGPQGGGDLSNIANGYRAGANLSIPFSEIFNRGNRIQLQQHELEATFFKTREMELVVSEQVVEEYNSLLLAHRLMQIRYEMQEKARTNLQQMEMEFNMGNLDAASYMRNAEIHTIARSEYENARSDFFVAAKKLEILIGMPLANIILRNDN